MPESINEIPIPPEFQELVEQTLKNALKSAFESVSKGVQVKWRERDPLGKARADYISFIRRDIGVIQILGLRQPIPLEEIYIPSRFYKYADLTSSLGEFTDSELKYGRHAFYRMSNVTNADLILSVAAQQGVMVVGDPGAGKSTFLRAIALASITDSDNLSETRLEGKFPIYVELRKYAEFDIDENSIFDYFCLEFGDDDFRVLVKWLLENGKAVILLDALDEVPAEVKAKVIDRIKKMRRNFDRCPMIISSRLGERSVVPGLPIYDIADFLPIERERYIDSWFKLANDPRSSNGLIVEINHQPGLREITTNPLLLSLVCLLYSTDREIPNKRTTIYRRCVEILIRSWDAERGFKRRSDFSSLDADSRVLIISELAVYLMDTEQRYIPEHEMVKKLGNILDRYEIEPVLAKDFALEVFSHHGIIVRAGTDLYGFSHLTFQEYLSAHHFVVKGRVNELIDKLVIDEKWREPFLLAMGEIADAKEAIKTISKHRKIPDIDKLEYISTILNASKSTISPEDRNHVFKITMNITLRILSKYDINGVRLIKDQSAIHRMIRESGHIIHSQKIKNFTEVFRIDKIQEAGKAIGFVIDCRNRPWFHGSLDDLAPIKDDDIKSLIQMIILEGRIYVCGFHSYESFILIEQIDDKQDISEFTDFINDPSLLESEGTGFDIDIDFS